MTKDIVNMTSFAWTNQQVSPIQGIGLKAWEFEDKVEPNAEDEIGFDNELKEPDFENSINVPQSLRYHGYGYIQVYRGGRSCLYRQTLGKKTIGYEVFIIRIQQQTTINGKVYQERERFPKDEDFGRTAWTYWTLEQAMKKFNEVETKFIVR